MTNNVPIILEEVISTHSDEKRIDIKLSREGDMPFASSFSIFLDNHYVLRENNGFYSCGGSHRKMSKPSSEGNWSHYIGVDFGVAHSFEEARERIYKRASRQAKKVADSEERPYHEIRS